MANPEGIFQNLSVNQRAVLEAFVTHSVEFLVLGGYAVRAHQHLRSIDPLRETTDLDIMVAANDANATKVDEALKSTPVGRMVTDKTKEQLAARGFRFRFADCDIQTEHDSLPFAEARGRAIEVDWRGTSIPIVSVPDLLDKKRRSLPSRIGTPQEDQDRSDIALLEDMCRARED